MTIKTSTKSISKRIFSAVLGIAVILCLLTGISLVTGNPFIQALVKNKTAKYLAANYPQYSFTLERAGKQSTRGFNYTFKAQAAEEIDVNFLVTMSLNGRVNDSYEHHVASKINTQRRLNSELAVEAAKALSKDMPELIVKACTTIYGYDINRAENFQSIAYADALTLNMPFNSATISVPTQLDLTLIAQNPNEKTMTEILPKIKAAMENNLLHFNYYTVTLEIENASLDATALQTDQRYKVENLPTVDIL